MEVHPVRADPRSMSTLLEFRDVHRHEWRPEELSEMLRHQFAVPLQLSLGPLSGEVAHQLRVAEPPLDPLMNLDQLLRHPQPPVELLTLVKRFAKMCRSDPDNPLPSEIVMLLYYTSIAIALVRVRQRISQLAPSSLARGLRWLSSQAWVDEETRGILQDSLKELGSKEFGAESVAGGE